MKVRVSPHHPRNYGRLRRDRGLTLIELMVVMVILVMLAAIVSTVAVKRVEEARRAKARADIAAIESALDQYAVQCGTYPTQDQGLAALRTKPTTPPVPDGWSGPYLKKDLPKDPWGHDYVYKIPGDHNTDSFDLYSFGKDGQEGGTGDAADITNWEN